MSNASENKPITDLLVSIGQGHASAQDRLWSLVYDELRRMASHQMAQESPGHTLQTTALVHEAYIRLIGNDHVEWKNRRHFFKAASEAMRRIRIDEARRRKRLKRGGGRVRVSIDDAEATAGEDPAQLLAISDALRKLEQVDSRKAEVVQLRFFGGLSIDETAQALDLSPRTVDSDWHFARAWLHRELKKGDTSVGKNRNGDDH